MDEPVRMHLILLAGGSGSRASSGRGAPPKQFCVTRRGPLFTISLRAFLTLDSGSGFRPRFRGGLRTRLLHHHQRW